MRSLNLQWCASCELTAEVMLKTSDETQSPFTASALGSLRTSHKQAETEDQMYVMHTWVQESWYTDDDC